MRRIVNYYGAYLAQEDGDICMGLELMEAGSLETVLKHGELPENVIGKVCEQILLALHYLHSEAKILHRDLKPGNVLVHRVRRRAATPCRCCQAPTPTRTPRQHHFNIETCTAEQWAPRYNVICADGSTFHFPCAWLHRCTPRGAGCALRTCARVGPPMARRVPRSGAAGR